MVKRGSRQTARGPRPPATAREWIGGILEPPFFVTDRDEPYRPGLVVWMEQPSGLVVGQQVVAPEETDGAVARVLLAALEKPLVGVPRRPDLIRVAEASLAAEVKAVLGGAIPIDVGPTPQLDEVEKAMVESMSADDDDNDSYLEGGRIPPEAVGEFFTCAELLYRIAPWKVAADSQVLRMDIPELGVEGACLSIIGALGESLGLLIFPSLAAYEAFLRFAERPRRKRGRADLGTGWLALNFDRGADLPASMRREVARHGWSVAAAEAYPRVAHYDRDGTCRPLAMRDLKIVSACAASLSSFFFKHEHLFEVEEFDPVCESYFDENDLEVRFTVPYEAFSLFESDTKPEWANASGRAPGAERRPKVGRNDPCPCGSGRKYKKCHLSADKKEGAAESGTSPFHDLDAQMVSVLSQFADNRFGDAWWRFERDFEDAHEALSLALPWSVYTFRIDGRTVVETYLDERGARCSSAEKAWLGSQQTAWLSVWEVVEFDPGKTITLHDLLSDETRCVREVEGSQTVVVRDTLLARVVDHEGASLLGGAHPRLLAPLDAAEVVRRARGRLRRKRAVPVERLRDERFGRYLIRRWEEAVAQFDARRDVPPELCNTDGDPLIITNDRFEIARGARSAVEERIAALEGVTPPGEGAKSAAYSFSRPGNAMHTYMDSTLIGQARISDKALELETNSRERADALRARVEAACGERIRHRIRSHVDPISPKVVPGGGKTTPEPPVPDAEKIVLEFKRRHYADWIDHPLAALGGKTPRDTARTAAGRAAVDILLKDMENREQRSAGAAAFDFSQIRRQLRLD